MKVSLEKIVDVKERQPVEDWFVLDDYHRITPEFYEKAEKGEVSNGSERCNRGILARGLQKYKAVPCQEAWEIALNIPFLEVLDSIDLLCDEADKQRAEEEKKRIEESYKHWLKTEVPEAYREVELEDQGEAIKMLFRKGTGILLNPKGKGKKEVAWAFAKEWKKRGEDVLVYDFKKIKDRTDRDFRSYEKFVQVPHLLITGVVKEPDLGRIPVIVNDRLDDLKSTILLSTLTEEAFRYQFGSSLFLSLTEKLGSCLIIEER